MSFFALNNLRTTRVSCVVRTVNVVSSVMRLYSAIGIIQYVPYTGLLCNPLPATEGIGDIKR